MKSGSANAVNNISDEMLYLILKTENFSCFRTVLDHALKKNDEGHSVGCRIIMAHPWRDNPQLGTTLASLK